LELAAQFVPAADEVYRLQNIQNGTDPECRLFQKFAEQGHYRRPGATRQGTYAVTPSGVLLASLNSNDPARVADMLRRALTKWQTLSREERLLPDDPRKRVANIKRPERFYPKDGLVLFVTSRDLPRAADKQKPAQKNWRQNQDYAWFTKREARQFLPKEPQAGKRHDIPLPIIHRIACAHLVDNVRGQTAPFEERQVEKARLVAEVTAVDGNVVTLRLEGETRAADEKGSRKHGLEMRLLGKASYSLTKERFQSFEMVALGARWGGTQNNSRHGDLDEGPIGLLFTLAGGGPCERVAPAFNQHRVYRAVASGK
jgi:hypothetical protein